MGNILNQDQVNQLTAPLAQSLVKSRKQGGREVSYIEGWKAIEEANRIFGFDGWTRETVEIKCVSEAERSIGQQGNKGFGVTYIVKVRVMVGNVCREGCGAGHGIDRDLGQAHESAIKEAETDAMKRALMTFGNPFGLALYDKTQANVVDDSHPRQNPHVTRAEDIFDGSEADVLPRPDIGTAPLSKAKANPLFKELQAELWQCGSVAQMEAWSAANKDRIGKLPDDWYKMMRGVYVEHKAEIIKLEIGDDNRMAG